MVTCPARSWEGGQTGCTCGDVPPVVPPLSACPAALTQKRMPHVVHQTRTLFFCFVLFFLSSHLPLSVMFVWVLRVFLINVHLFFSAYNVAQTTLRATPAAPHPPRPCQSIAAVCLADLVPSCPVWVPHRPGALSGFDIYQKSVFCRTH